MAIEQRRELGSVTVRPDGQIELRENTIFADGKNVLGYGLLHRTVLDPGVHQLHDVPAGLAKTVADAVWTPDVIAARKRAAEAVQQEQQPKRATKSQRSER